MRLVAEGLSNRQIARRLVVSEATVKTHLNHVLSKLDVDGRPGLVAWAWRQGLAGSVLALGRRRARRVCAACCTRWPRTTRISVRVNTSPRAISTSAAVQASPLVMWCSTLNWPSCGAPPCEAQKAKAKREAHARHPRAGGDPAGLDQRVAAAVGAHPGGQRADQAERDADAR